MGPVSYTHLDVYKRQAYGFGTIDDDVPAIRKFSELPQVADRVFDEIEKL